MLYESKNTKKYHSCKRFIEKSQSITYNLSKPCFKINEININTVIKTVFIFL